MEGFLFKYDWESRWKIRHQGADFISYFLGVTAFLSFANPVVVAAAGSLLKSHYPRSLGFRDTIITLYILSALSVLPLLLTGDALNKSSRLMTQAASVSLFSLTSLHMYTSFGIHENLRLIWEVRSLKNSNDTDVAFLTTYYLAAYNECCFLADEEIPALDCISTDFEVPCYEDEELFNNFRNSFEFENVKCVALTGSDESNDGFCDKSLKRFFKALGNRAYRGIWVISISTFIYGFFALWYASECFYWAIGEIPHNF